MDPRAQAKTDAGKCSRVDELIDLREEFGEAAWIHGLTECRRLGKAGTAYLKSICVGGAPDQAAPGSGRRLIPDDGLAAAREFEKGLDAEDEERKAAWEREEAARKAAEESAR